MSSTPRYKEMSHQRSEDDYQENCWSQGNADRCFLIGCPQTLAVFDLSSTVFHGASQAGRFYHLFETVKFDTILFVEQTVQCQLLGRIVTNKLERKCKKAVGCN